MRIIESVAKGLGLPMEKMFVNVDRYGNTSAASVPIALAEAVDSGRIKVGDKIVLVAFGAGLTSGGDRARVDGRSGCTASARQTVEPVASVREPLDWASVDPIPDRLTRHPRGAARPCRSTTSCPASPSPPTRRSRA